MTLIQRNEHQGTLLGTASGTLLSIFANIDSGDLAKTVILASVGAVVSFGVSAGLRWLGNYFRRRNRPP
jgi:hypothetical protein